MIYCIKSCLFFGVYPYFGVSSSKHPIKLYYNSGWRSIVPKFAIFLPAVAPQNNFSHLHFIDGRHVYCGATPAIPPWLDCLKPPGKGGGGGKWNPFSERKICPNFSTFPFSLFGYPKPSSYNMKTNVKETKISFDKYFRTTPISENSFCIRMKGIYIKNGDR